MTPIYIYPTEQLPMVHLDQARGIYIISGRSIAVSAGQFYAPILKWMDQLSLQAHSEKVCFSFGMELMNITSYKRLLLIMYKLKEMQQRGVEVIIEWNFERFDVDMAEIGLDYADLVSAIPFTHIECASLAFHQMLKAS